jgi:hypothetical protein
MVNVVKVTCSARRDSMSDYEYRIIEQAVRAKVNFRPQRRKAPIFGYIPRPWEYILVAEVSCDTKQQALNIIAKDKFKATTANNYVKIHPVLKEDI